MESSFDDREACQLIQGLTMISEVFGGFVDSVGTGGGGGAAQSLLEEARLVSVHAVAAAAELAACQVRNGGLGKLTAQQLSGAAMALALGGHGMNDSYRALTATAAAARAASAPPPPRPTGRSCGTPWPW